ncbi:hypothetical protein JTB14_012344 [Gonioctena quinquepunctata]|nr:hypothetical protein JTB14_012344 [Gonioctena quinquepunctata]
MKMAQSHLDNSLGIAVLENNEKEQRKLGVEEIEEAEKYWIRSLQLQSFMENITILRQGKPVGKRSNLKQLSPVFENELLVLGSRLKFVTIMEERARKPFILHPKHLFTRLLITLP